MFHFAFFLFAKSTIISMGWYVICNYPKKMHSTMMHKNALPFSDLQLRMYSSDAVCVFYVRYTNIWFLWCRSRKYLAVNDKTSSVAFISLKCASVDFIRFWCLFVIHFVYPLWNSEMWAQSWPSSSSTLSRGCLFLRSFFVHSVSFFFFFLLSLRNFSLAAYLFE